MTAIKATREVVTNYWQRFVNRRAYTVQVHSSAPGNRAALLFPANEGSDRHLEGKITVGLYAVNLSTQRRK